MLPIEQIIPFLRHEDSLVTRMVVDCLKSVRWPVRLTSDFVLEAIRERHSSLQKYLHDFEVSAATFRYSIDQLNSPSLDPNQFFPYGVVDRARDSLFTPEVIAELRDKTISVDWVAEALRLRFELLNMPTERLRQEFLAECDRANADRSAMSQQSRTRALVDRLVYRGDSIIWCREQLAREMGSDGWAEIWLFALLIKAEDRAILPEAAERFQTTSPDNNEALFSELITAMHELATPQDIPLLKTVWDNCAADQRGGLVEAVSKLRFAEAEPLLLHVAKETPDQTIRSYAAVGLCEMIATGEESIEFVRDLTNRGDFDTTYASLEEWAIPLGIILGRPFPEEAQWRARLTDENELLVRRKRFLGGENSPLARLAGMLGTLTSKPAAPATKARATSAGVSDRTTTLKTSRTAGRNDPCPCGSGKKFKKCCGGK